MNLHEYQAKEILKMAGIAVPRFGVARSRKEAAKVIRELGLKTGVVKIQVHAGGRGKAGGVKFGKTAEELEKVAEALIGMKLINNQTGPEGVVAHAVLISEDVKIKKEFYLGAIIDRERGEPVLIASPEGGMEIEEIARKSPEKILKLPIALDGSMRPYHLLRLKKFMDWKETGMAEAVAKVFMERDGSLLEINPVVEDEEGKLWALDAKFSVDDNALFRQKDVAAYYDATQHSKNEVLAREYELSYIALKGSIGCMVNGAGLAMATMDIIQYAGGSPANFLDVGGSATAEKITAGFEILASDLQVKAILINIFGGIMSCATIAEGVIEALKKKPVTIPIVVRMEGTHVEEGKKKLQKSGHKIITADNLTDAATVVVKESHAHSR